MWLRVVLLLAIAGWGLYVAVRREERVLRRLGSAARGSARRAFLVITGYYVALVAFLALCGLVGALAHRAGLPVLTVLVLLIGLTLTAPFLWLFMPVRGVVPGPSTSVGDLRSQGVQRSVARAIAYPALVYHLVLLVPAMIAMVMAVILVD